jgi:hypothetical protein
MATPYTSNNGSTFYNQNDCRSFNQTITTNLTQLTAYPCSEVIIINKTGQSVLIYDNNFFEDTNNLLLEAGDSIALRGITSTSQVSAKTSSLSGTLYYRTQYFSMLPQR